VGPIGRRLEWGRVKGGEERKRRGCLVGRRRTEGGLRVENDVHSKAVWDREIGGIMVHEASLRLPIGPLARFESTKG